MEEQIKQIQNNAIEEISLSQDVKALEETKVKYLGKKGELTAILRGMGGLSPEERPIIGSLVNEVREKIELILKQKEEELKNKEMEENCVVIWNMGNITKSEWEFCGGLHV